MACPKGGECVPYSSAKGASRVILRDWCIKCGRKVRDGKPQRG